MLSHLYPFSGEAHTAFRQDERGILGGLENDHITALGRAGGSGARSIVSASVDPLVDQDKISGKESLVHGSRGYAKDLH
jgi:hypothetical protein